MGSIIALIVEYLPIFMKAAKSVPEIVTFVQKTRETLKQTQEWTPAQEEAFDKYLDEVTSQPWWQPEQK